MVGVVRGHQRADRLKPYSQKTSQSDHRTTALCNSVKLSHAVWGHPRRTGHGGEVWQNVVHWRREWQTTSVFLPWELCYFAKQFKWNQESSEITPTPLAKFHFSFVYNMSWVSHHRYLDVSQGQQSSESASYLPISARDSCHGGKVIALVEEWLKFGKKLHFKNLGNSSVI